MKSLIGVASRSIRLRHGNAYRVGEEDGLLTISPLPRAELRSVLSLLEQLGPETVRKPARLKPALDGDPK